MASSKMLDGYCADVEHLVREGSLRQGVQLAVALPDICAALESPAMQSSHEDYIRWCERWLKFDVAGRKPVTADRVFRLHARHGYRGGTSGDPTRAAQVLVKFRMRRHSRSYREHGRPRVWEPQNRLESFQVALCEALLSAARSWYREHGRHDQTVQANIGKLVLTR